MGSRRDYLLFRLLVGPLAVPDAWPPSILIDELDAGGFEGVPNRQIVGGGQ
jgi:hypothetical protein